MTNKVKSWKVCSNFSAHFKLKKIPVRKQKWRTNSIKKLQIIVCEYATFLFSFYLKPTGEENFYLVPYDSVVFCRQGSPRNYADHLLKIKRFNWLPNSDHVLSNCLLQAICRSSSWRLFLCVSLEYLQVFSFSVSASRDFQQLGQNISTGEPAFNVNVGSEKLIVL